MSHSENIDQLLPALVAAQSEFPPIPRDGFNPHFKSRFSTLKAVQQATQPVLAAHGLLLSQWPCQTDQGEPALKSKLAHTSGQWMEEVTPLLLSKRDPQAHGSAITYLRRYCWSSILGLVTDEDDDDGHVATVVAPKVSAAKLADIKALAVDAGMSLGAVATWAGERFGKQVPELSPKQADELADHLAQLVAQNTLGAKEAV